MLNTQEYNGLELTKENILSIVSEEDIFAHYISGLPVDKTILSPIRNDKNPNFRLYYNLLGQIRYNDFGYTKGSCFDFVMNYYNVDFFNALKKINEDLKLGLDGNCKIEYSRIKIERPQYQKKEILLQAIERKNSDLSYWKQRGVNEKIIVANSIHLNKVPIWYYTESNPIFVYYFPKSNHIKAYRPFEKDKKRKWISNCDIYDVFGWEEFIKHDKVNNLIITKAGKDRLILKHLGYISIAPQAEGNSFPEEYIEIIKSKANNIWINMDNDEAGNKATHKYCEMLDTDLVFNTHKKDVDESYIDNKELLIKQLKIIE